MNNGMPFQDNIAMRGNVRNILTLILCFALALIAILGVKSFIKNVSMPEDLKEAKSILEDEDFSSIKHLDDEDDIEEWFEDLDIELFDVTDALVAVNHDSEDIVVVLYCKDIEAAEQMLFEFSGIIAEDDFLYHRGYVVEKNYRTVYFGHKDIVDELLE